MKVKGISSILVIFVAFIVAIFFCSITEKLEPVNHGDVTVITGAGTGIGKHAALSLAKQGFTVFAGVLNSEEGEALLQSAARHSLNATKIRPLVLDVTNSDHISQGVLQVSNFLKADANRRFVGLFNNAGIARTGDPFVSRSVEHLPMNQYRGLFDVNVFGNIEMTQAFLPLLRKYRGRVLFTSSVAGKVPGAFGSAYASSKFAVEGFADSLRRELRPHGVKVSVLEPGYVYTPIWEHTTKANVPESIQPYAHEERRLFSLFFRMAIRGGVSPKVTSDVAVHVMRARNPKTRYLVGKDVWTLNFVSLLPDSWLDRLLEVLLRGEEGVSDEERKILLERAVAEYPI